MSYHLPNRRTQAPRPAGTANTLAPESDPALQPDSFTPPRHLRMDRRLSAAGARLHARFAETARKTFT